MIPNPLPHTYGSTVIVRPPVPATCNKAGANYKSEVPHLEYSPRRAYDEWLAICEAILACGGDAVFEFEAIDEPFLDHEDLHVLADGTIRSATSTRAVGHLDEVMTGRVFTANGPWMSVAENTLRAVMPHMLAHRAQELHYYDNLLATLASLCGYQYVQTPCPHPWEGMADITVIESFVILTHTVPGHYDEAVSPKSSRSSQQGVAFAANWIGVPQANQIFAELVYPHFHGDTVHFCARPQIGKQVLFQYPRGLWGKESNRLIAQLEAGVVQPMSQSDAVDHYAGNSRQICNGVLVPKGVSKDFRQALQSLKLSIHTVELSELFGKAGGGPACATLYLPSNLRLPHDAAIRYSVRREEAHSRRNRYPQKLHVDPAYFSGKHRG